MIEEILIEYISRKLQIPVYFENPEEPPETYVVLEKNSDSRENLIDRARFFAFCYAPSKVEACCLSNELVNIMFDIVELKEVCKASLENEFDDSDTNRKEYRYRSEYDLVYYR